MENILIGRNKEISELQRCYESNRSEFIIVYGRRRIGKTYLVRHCFQDKYDFMYVGARNLTQQRQLERFANSLCEFANLITPPVLKDWFEAFDQLKSYLQSLPKQRKVIFIDEMPWIDSYKSDFIKALETFWNGWAAMRDDIFFVACGSSTSWMVNNLIENQGGLHNRITNQIYLRPFNLNECEQYIESFDFGWDRYQIMQCYMALGGVPFYLSLLNPSWSLAQNLDNLFFRRNALLQQEFNELYNALFKHADKYIDVVRALSTKREGLTRQQISEMTGISGGGLTKILNNLERCDFILQYAHFGKTKNNSIYRLSDFYTLFYFSFAEKHDGKDEKFWTHNMNSPAVRAWQGFTFELLCMVHLDQIKQSLGISGIATESSTWRSKDKETEGAQIDLVISRADRIISLCEMKFSEEKYGMTEDYAEKLRDRMGIFRQETKTKRGLQNILVTPFGLTKSKHNGIINNVITAEGLFRAEE